MNREIADARTLLFVPGDRRERFGKAAGAGVDLIVIDLEDAVASDAKAAAREAARDYLSSGGRAVIRINAADTAGFDDDVALAELPGTIALMLPKAQVGDGLCRVSATGPTIALIESAAGIHDVDAIAATVGIDRLAFGTIDLMLDLDVTSATAIEQLGTRLVLASRMSGLPAPIDGVTTSITDLTLIEADARSARSRGFGGKLCIHPAQIAAARMAWVPTPAELAWAERIMGIAQATGGGAVRADGEMIDAPVYARAHRIVREAARATHGGARVDSG